MKYSFENLALSGGGVWGIAYLGMLEELERAGALAQIQRVVGASAGMVAFFETALRVNDFLLPRVEARNWTEQLAWSLVACDGRQPLALGDALHHYWNYSYEAPLYLAEVFAGMAPDWDVARQAEFCGEFAWDEARLKTIQADPEHKRQRRRNKLRNSIAKRKVDWRILLARLCGTLPSAD